MTEATPVAIARVCHEANRAWCKIIGDESQPAWDIAPEWQKESAVAGVLFHMEHVAEGGPASPHEEWMRHKRQEGWIYGPEKDPKKKTHPCMVPFEALPPEQQMKDRIFRGIVLSMLG